MATLEAYGRPVEVYVDQAGHFGRKGSKAKSVIARGLEELDVRMILAGSPQAKGRVERNFRTAQDRLIKEMRVRGITTFEEANRYLREHGVPLWNDRWAREPADCCDAHRPVPEEIDLHAVFAQTESRKVGRDFTIRYRNEVWQIPEGEAGSLAPGDEIIVERRLTGEIRFRAGARYLSLEPFTEPVPDEQPERKQKKQKPPKPAPDHPWRQHFAASAALAMAKKARRESMHENGVL